MERSGRSRGRGRFAAGGGRKRVWREKRGRKGGREEEEGNEGE